MKRLGLQINMGNDTANIFDKVIDLGKPPSGHYFIPTRDCNILIKDVHFATEDKKRIVQKHHRHILQPEISRL